MRYISIFTHEKKNNVPPTEAEMAAMGKLIEDGMKSGWLIATEGVSFGGVGVRVHKPEGGDVIVTIGESQLLVHFVTARHHRLLLELGKSDQRIVPAVGRAGRATRAAARCRTYALRRIVAGIRRATLRCRADDCVHEHPCKAARGIRQADSARVSHSVMCVEVNRRPLG